VLKSHTRHADTNVVRTRDQSGFTLIEVMVAALVLAIGLAATFSLIDRANSSISQNNARMSAANLGRELVEYARGTDYDRLQPDDIEAALRSHARVDGSGSPWRVERQRVDYTVNVDVCAFDDPKDGISATPPPNACTPAAAAVAGAPEEVNPDDFRRVTFRIAWTDKGGPHTLEQTTMVVNPAGGLGPQIESFIGPVGDVTTSVVHFDVQTSPAQTLRWNVDDGVSQGELPGGGTEDWDIDWSLDTFDVGDGTYRVSAQAFDSRGVPGEARAFVVHVNRFAPLEVAGAEGGRNVQHGGVVDLRWTRSPERDVIGYRVYRVPLVGANERICDDPGLTYTTRTSCVDTSPPGGPLIFYQVVAVDRQTLSAASSTPREGAALLTPLTIGPAGAEPATPTDLAVTTDTAGLPVLTWTAVPDGALPIRFYRIYRDAGTALGGRYDVTITDEPTYTDPKPATGGHTYWVTAVDSAFNESSPSDPVGWTP
jgi:prepilin-type N-terminal cleavage/methylation domain-containing protein